MVLGGTACPTWASGVGIVRKDPGKADESVCRANVITNTVVQSAILVLVRIYHNETGSISREFGRCPDRFDLVRPRVSGTQALGCESGRGPVSTFLPDPA